MNCRQQALLALSFSAASILAAPPAESPFSMPQPAFYGQIRPRMELSHKGLADTSHTSQYTQLRSRLGFTAVTSEFTEVKFEIQDTRVLGGEPQALGNPTTATVGNSKGVDLTQGYGALEFLFGEDMALKTAAGRMKMSLGAGRFMSTLEWAPTARQFDGIASNFRKGTTNVTGMAYMVKDSSQATPSDIYHTLYGLYASHPIQDTMFLVEGGVFYDKNRIKTSAAAANPDTTSNYDLVYLDGRATARWGMVLLEQEFIFQTGEAALKNGVGVESKAFYSATRAGVVLPKLKANLGLDIMSGDDKGSDLTQYRASYYFAHAYFGWMDYFVNNPRYGVMDYRADADVALGEWGSFKAQYHYFMPQQDKDVLGKTLDAYGQEINTELSITRFPKTNIVLGASVFFPGDGAYMLTGSQLAATTKSAPGYYLYLMPVFNF